jgi:hypothetical protein
MNLKNKTYAAFTVKLLFCVAIAHAQQPADTVKQKAINFFTVQTNPSLIKNTILLAPLPGNFYSKQLPFFCNKELQIQKAVGIPIKFRVGSVEYCDKLEGKK